MNKHKNNRKRNRTETAYVEEPLDKGSEWRNAKNQKSYGTDFTVLDPLGVFPTKLQFLDFEVPTNKFLKFNSKTHFYVKGQILKKTTTGTGATAVVSWEKVNPAASKFLLSPNWFERCIKKIEVSSLNSNISAHDLPDNLLHEINALLLATMHPKLKDRLAPESGNPVRNYEMSKFWTINTNESNGYNSSLLGTDGLFEFKYTPLNVWPFYQKPSFDLNSPQEDLPTSIIGKMFIRMSFIDDFSTLLITTTAGESSADFKIEFTSIQLILEEERPMPLLKTPKSIYSFKGHSLNARFENVPGGEMTYKARFLKIPFPEQILLIGLPKTKLAGTYNFSEIDLNNTDIQHFTPLNLKSVELLYNHQPLATSNPNFMEFDVNAVSPYVLLNALRKNGILGVPVDPTLLTYKNALENFQGTMFPFFLVDCTLQNGTGDRIQPSYYSSDNSAYSKDAIMDIFLKYNTNGAPSNIDTVFIFCYRSKNAMIIDPKTGIITNMNANLKITNF
jgi:hypothetical protein